MKFFNLKNKIGMNLIGISGLIFGAYYCWVILSRNSDENNPFGLFLILLAVIVEIIICISIVIYCIEYVINHKIQNKFILQNKIYNIFWTVGMFISILLTLAFIAVFCWYIFS